MAKTYSECCPSESILVVDSAASIGGVWAAERVYPGLKTNNLIGSYEFSDFPMVPEKYGCRSGQHIPGAVVHTYLCDAVKHFCIASKIRLNTKVQVAKLEDDSSWIVETAAHSSTLGVESLASRHELRARKLVLATGTTSEPFRPTFDNESAFVGPILHSKELQGRSSELASASSVVVVGGNKSAFDVCYTAAQNGSEVHMVMRPRGGGPNYVWPARFTWFWVTTSLARLSCTRFAAYFDPCIWVTGWIQWFLHRTWVGRLLTMLFWQLLRHRIEEINGYDKSDGTRLVKPWTSPYWMGNSLSVHNYEESWFDLAARGKIKVHIADIEYLSERAVHLSNGETLSADALVCCTGWKAAPPIRFIPDDLPSTLGLPGAVYEHNSDTLRADQRVFSLFPDLSKGPDKHIPIPGDREKHWDFEQTQREYASTAYQLYRFLVPTNPAFLRNRTIAFIGAHLSVHAIVLAQVQALWITAFFMDRVTNIFVQSLASAKLEDIKNEAVLHAEFERLRHPPEAGGSGQRYPDLIFDSIPYVDMLLKDLGMQVHRKPSWYKELFEPHGVRDYRDLTQDWINNHSMRARYH